MNQSSSWMKRSLIILPVAFTFAKNDTCECCHLMAMSFGASGRSHVCLTWRGRGLCAAMRLSVSMLILLWAFNVTCVSWPCLTSLPCLCSRGCQRCSGAVEDSAVWAVLCVSPPSSLCLLLLFPGCLDLSDLLLLWTHVFMGPGTIRKAQNLLKQYSQHGLDGKKGGSNLTPLEGNTTPPPPLPPHLFGFSSSLTVQTCRLPYASQQLSS